jgi:AraC-like DNA-binding protein
MQNSTNIFDNITVNNLISRVNVCAMDWGETDCIYGYNKFYYFLDGEGTLIIDGNEYHPERGDLFMIPADTRHTYFHNQKRPVYKYWCHFEMALNNGQKLTYSKTAVKCKVPMEEIVPVFKKLVDSEISANPMDTLSEKSALLDLLRIFMGYVDYKSLLPVDSDDFVTRINDYIIQNIHTNITLRQLAEIVHLHPNYFTQYFRKHFNTSPIVHVYLMRLDRANQLLIHAPDKSIKEVAQEVGFNDYRYFSRLFKKRYGITPSAYKGIHCVL